MAPTAPQGIIEALGEILPENGLITAPAELRPFECDALTMYKTSPICVALPRDETQLAGVLRMCHSRNVPVVTRGAGTGLSGGAHPRKDAVLLVTSRLNAIMHIDPLMRIATVQPGVRNLAVSQAAARHGLFYAPDPSSQVACTIGGNIAENSGGVRCLKYGLTVHNVQKLRCFAMNGEEFSVGGPADAGYDLLAMLHGSEGMLAVVVEAELALTPLPEATRTLTAAFDSVADACAAVARIITTGIVPAGLELMDRLSVELVEEFVGAGYPLDAAAVIICETDGLEEDAQDEMEKVREICGTCRGRDLKLAASEAERTLMWLGRKSALPAVGRRYTDYYCIDGTIPRRHLAHVLEHIGELSLKHGLPCANVFHAGDGNLHPLIMFNAGNADQTRRAQLFGTDILTKCVAIGGTITGEHGVGIEKLGEMCVQFSPEELECYRQIKLAFDPAGLLNPGKAVPTLQRCAEFGAMHVQSGKEKFPDLERF